MAERTIVIFGAGPGIGNHVAIEFATHGHFTHLVLAARDPSRLAASARAVSSAASKGQSGQVGSVKISTVQVDLSDLDGVRARLAEVEKVAGGVPEVVYYNAARIHPTENILDLPVKEIEEDLKTQVLGLHAVAQWAIPGLQTLAGAPNAHPSLLVTNSHLPESPIPALATLSLSKAAQKNLVNSFHQAFSPSGVHVGLVAVCGPVSPEEPDRNPINIARKAFELYEQPRGSFELETRIGVPPA